MILTMVAVLLSLALTGHPAPPAPPLLRQDTVSSDTLRFGRFGPVVLYHQRVHPARVVLLVSGDGGWNHGVVDMARRIAGMDALVAGIDIRSYLATLAGANERCSYPAADFEALSQWLQRKLGFPRYVSPMLVGYSSGATLAYATLAQAPPGTFAGAVSLGFCPDLAVPRPLCEGSGLAVGPGSRGYGISVAPDGHLATPWVVLQGKDDATCAPAQAVAFARRVRGAESVLLPGVGHGFAVTAHWMPQLRDAFARIERTSASAPHASAPAVADLPLVELPARGSKRLAVVVSGDGGWASLDRQIGETLSSDGVSVVGLNALQYFWRARTPDGAAADLTRILRHYLARWSASEIVLVGFSRGADVLPFMASRLPADLRSKVRLVALLGLSHRAGFEFHLADFFGRSPRDAPATVPEIGRLRGMRILCVYGTDETDTACPDLPADLATRVGLPGGHHFGGAYRQIAARILKEAGGWRAGEEPVGDATDAVEVTPSIHVSPSHSRTSRRRPPRNRKARGYERSA